MDGKHMKKGKDVSAAVNAKAAATPQESGAAEAQKMQKSVANVMYPVRRGLRGQVMKDNMDERDRRQ